MERLRLRRRLERTTSEEEEVIAAQLKALSKRNRTHRRKERELVQQDLVAELQEHW